MPDGRLIQDGIEHFNVVFNEHSQTSNSYLPRKYCLIINNYLFHYFHKLLQCTHLDHIQQWYTIPTNPRTTMMQARAMSAAPRSLTSPPRDGTLGTPPPVAVLTMTAGGGDSAGGVGSGVRIGGRIWTAWTPRVLDTSESRLSVRPSSSRDLLYGKCVGFLLAKIMEIWNGINCGKFF